MAIAAREAAQAGREDVENQKAFRILADSDEQRIRVKAYYDAISVVR